MSPAEEYQLGLRQERHEQQQDEERAALPHAADECVLEVCAYCGCCEHGFTRRVGCKVESAPDGMRCPEWGCGCEGRS